LCWRAEQNRSVPIRLCFDAASIVVRAGAEKRRVFFMCPGLLPKAGGAITTWPVRLLRRNYVILEPDLEMKIRRASTVPQLPCWYVEGKGECAGRRGQ